MTHKNPFVAGSRSLSEGIKIRKTIGFDASEKRRTYAGGGTADTELYDMWYPLQEWDWDREHCKQVISDEGLPVPPKSACFFCPAMKKHEIHDLRKNDPEQFRLALEMEEGYRTGKHWRGDEASTIGLGRRFAWGELPVVELSQGELFGVCDGQV